MKKICISCWLALLLMAGLAVAAQQTTNNSGDNSFQIKGAYSMLRQMANDGTKDSMMHSEQFKIYTDRYMLYVHPKAGDTLAEYGVGKYEIKNGKVIEYVFHNSNTGAVKDTFELNIFKMGNGYRQTIQFPEGEGRKWTLVEDYINVSKNTTSPLDGAWKQTKWTQVAANGSRRTNNNPTQFKLFESGHFIWVRTTTDSATKAPVSYYGYGSFEMEGTNNLTEINTSSTFRSVLLGVPVIIKVEFPAKDTYRQTIVMPDGRKTIEEYKKMN